MAYTSPKKAQDLALFLYSKLQSLLAPLASSQSVAADGNPLLSFGPGTAGGANVIIKVLPQPWPTATDIVGNAANVYSPTEIQIVTEANPASGAGADDLTPQQVLYILGAIMQPGTRVEWYQSAAGTAPTAAAIIAANLKATWNPSLTYGVLNQM